VAAATTASQGNGSTPAQQQVRIQSLELQLQQAQSQLQRERAHWLESKAGYERSVEAVRAVFERRAVADTAATRALEGQLQSTTQRLSALTRDYLMLRLAASQADRKKEEELAKHAAARIEAENALAELQVLSAETTQALRAESEGAARDSAAVKRFADWERTGIVKAMRQRHQQELDACKATISGLQEELAVQRRKYADLSTRRARDADGFERDVSTLRRTVHSLEHRWALLAGIAESQALGAAIASAMGDASLAAGLANAPLAGAADSAAVSSASGSLELEAALHESQLSHADAAMFQQQQQQQQQQQRGRSARSSSRDRADRSSSASHRPRSSSRGATAARESWANLVPSATMMRESTPAAGAAVVTDPLQRERLRRKGALLSDNAILYRTARSSGYGPGAAGTVFPDDVNIAARQPPAAPLSGLEAHYATLLRGQQQQLAEAEYDAYVFAAGTAPASAAAAGPTAAAAAATAPLGLSRADLEGLSDARSGPYGDILRRSAASPASPAAGASSLSSSSLSTSAARRVPREEAEEALGAPLSAPSPASASDLSRANSVSAGNTTASRSVPSPGGSSSSAPAPGIRGGSPSDADPRAAALRAQLDALQSRIASLDASVANSFHSSS
jgi:hypothetical protein